MNRFNASFVICLILLSINSTHALPICSQALRSSAEDANGVSQDYSHLDLEYRVASSESPRPLSYHYRVTTLLNRAFFPMVVSLGQVVQSTSRMTISMEANKVAVDYPLLEGNFKRGKVGAKILGLNDPKIIERIEYAGSSYFSVYPTHVFETRENFNQKNSLHMNLLSLTPNYRRKERLGSLHDWFSTVVTPVGEYGRKFSEDLMITTQVLSQIAEQNFVDMSRSLGILAPGLILKATGRGMMASMENITNETAPLSSFVEGILSFHQLITLVLSEKIPGIENGPDALKAFIFSGKPAQGLTSALVKRIPLAVVGPMANAGVTRRRALILGVDGKLDISPEFIEDLAKHQERAKKSGRRGVCPMSLVFQGKNPLTESRDDNQESSEKTGLQIIAESYWRVFEIVAAEQR